MFTQNQIAAPERIEQVIAEYKEVFEYPTYDEARRAAEQTARNLFGCPLDQLSERRADQLLQAINVFK